MQHNYVPMKSSQSDLIFLCDLCIVRGNKKLNDEHVCQLQPEKKKWRNPFFNMKTPDYEILSNEVALSKPTCDAKTTWEK